MLLVLNYSHIIMSSFLRRYGRTALYGVLAASGAMLFIYYFFIKKKQTNVDDRELLGLERRRRVEKLVELRDKLVSYNLSMLSCFINYSILVELY